MGARFGWAETPPDGGLVLEAELDRIRRFAGLDVVRFKGGYVQRGG